MRPCEAPWPLSSPPGWLPGRAMLSGMSPSTCDNAGDDCAPAHNAAGHDFIPNATSTTSHYSRADTQEDRWLMMVSVPQDPGLGC